MLIGMNLAVENLKNTIVKDVNKSRLPAAVSYLVLESLLHELGEIKQKDIETERKDYEIEMQKGEERVGEALQPDILEKSAEPGDGDRGKQFKPDRSRDRQPG